MAFVEVIVGPSVPEDALAVFAEKKNLRVVELPVGWPAGSLDWKSVRGGFLIILLFPDIVQAGSDCATLLAGIPGYVLLWLAVCALSFRRRAAAAVTG